MSQIITFGGYVTTTRILWGLYTQADTFIIGKLLGKELLGFYSVGMTLAALPMEKVSGIVNQVAFPAFSSIQAEPAKVESYCLKAIRLMSFFRFPGIMGYVQHCPRAGYCLGWGKMEAGDSAFSIGQSCGPISYDYWPAGSRSIGAWAPGRISPPCIVFFRADAYRDFSRCPMGLIGISLAWVIVCLLVFFRFLSKMCPVLAIRLLDVLAAMARPLSAALIMYAAVIGFKTVLGTETKSIWHLLMLIMAGATVYVGVIGTLDRDRFREVRGLIRV